MMRGLRVSGCLGRVTLHRTACAASMVAVEVRAALFPVRAQLFWVRAQMGSVRAQMGSVRAQTTWVRARS